jgi:hypothetical protein
MGHTRQAPVPGPLPIGLLSLKRSASYSDLAPMRQTTATTKIATQTVADHAITSPLSISGALLHCPPESQYPPNGPSHLHAGIKRFSRLSVQLRWRFFLVLIVRKHYGSTRDRTSFDAASVERAIDVRSRMTRCLRLPANEARDSATPTRVVWRSYVACLRGTDRSR